ncbi:hypothetical protein AbraIFM66950_006440 [Aspergillus brasiliensis]|nr:hypothetical protein AbraIFM66950_006440 [Aspergillus brasiliensis]
MPLIYGEGDYKAFTRLQREIMRYSRDESILAWGSQGAELTTSDSVDLGFSAGVFAASPADFANCGKIVPRMDKAKSLTPFAIDGGLLRISLPLHFSTISGEVFGLLNCGPQHDHKAVVGVPLSNVASSEYLRPQGRYPNMFVLNETSASAQLVYIQTERQKKSTSEASHQDYFHIEDPLEAGLELIEVEPQDRWLKDRSIITTMNDPADKTIQQTWTRFRSESEGSSDFLVLLEFQTQAWQVQARCHVMVATRNTSLADIARKAGCIRQGAFGKLGANNGTLSIQARVERDSMQKIFVVKLAAVANPPSVTVDATFELEVLMLKLQVESVMHVEDDFRLKADNFDQHELEATSSLESAKAGLIEIEEEIGRLSEQKSQLLSILSRASQAEIRQREAMLSERRRSLEGKLDGWKRTVLRTGYGLLLHQTGRGAPNAGGFSLTKSVPRGTSTEPSGWVRLDDETMLSDTEAVEAEAELNGLVGTDSDVVRHINNLLKCDPLLLRFFGNEQKRRLLVYIWKKAEDMYAGHERAHYGKSMAQTVKVSMYQQVFYCDDSSAMGCEDRWDAQKELVKRMAKVTTQMLPAGKGVALRFINHEVDKSPNLAFDRVKKIMNSMPLRLGGTTAIGKSLESKILAPLVYSKVKSQSLYRPLLIIITIGSRPESGAESEFVDAIIECGRKLEIAGYSRRSA